CGSAGWRFVTASSSTARRRGRLPPAPTPGGSRSHPVASRCWRAGASAGSRCCAGRFLAEAFAVIPIARRRLPSARLPFEDRRVLASAAGAAALSATLRRLGPTTVGREALASVLGLLPALAALRDRELARYHGVELKAIGAYE